MLQIFKEGIIRFLIFRCIFKFDRASSNLIQSVVKSYYIVPVITIWLKIYSLSFPGKPLINSQILNLVSRKDNRGLESVNSNKKIILI